MDILVAEDDFVSRSLLVNILEKLGHTVQIAEDGLMAWEIMQNREIRMVVTDWMMPGLDGPSLCKKIRRIDTEAYVYIILLTAKDAKEDIVEGLEAGADDYLSKPFNKTEFIARLNSGLRILDLESSLKAANEKICLLTITDELTGCFNKRYLDQNLPREIDRASRLGHSISIILADIDHFKQVNDTHGHPVGDQVLRSFSSRLKACVRCDVDWVARYGGEEFLVVLPETDVAGGHSVGERLRMHVEQTSFSSDNGDIPITASFGVAGSDTHTPKKGISAEELLQRADQNLYQAKRNGRNQVYGEGL